MPDGNTWGCQLWSRVRCCCLIRPLHPGAQVVVALCCVALALATGILFCMARACSRPSTKVALGPDGLTPQQRHHLQQQQQRDQRQFVSSSQPPPRPSAPTMPANGGSRRAAQGVAYDEETGQFVVSPEEQLSFCSISHGLCIHAGV